MTEKLAGKSEHGIESIDTSLESKRGLEKSQEKANKSEELGKSTVEHLREDIGKEAISAKETTIGEKQESSPQVILTKKLKQDAYKKTIKKAQNSLSSRDRALSKIIHQPMIERISNVGAATFARSSGILGGGTVALIGSIGLLFASRHYGFSYNYLIIFILFLGGFFVGLLGELIVRVIHPTRH